MSGPVVEVTFDMTGDVEVIPYTFNGYISNIQHKRKYVIILFSQRVNGWMEA